MGDKAMTKAERDKRSRQRGLDRLRAMTEALAAIADPMLIRTLREARARAQGVLAEQGGNGVPSASER